MNKNIITKFINEDELVKYYEGGDRKEIETSQGIMSKSKLDRKVIPFEDDNELTYAIEYYLKGTDKKIHRSVHIQLKTNVVAGPAIAKF